jgi:hypothetical protein
MYGPGAGVISMYRPADSPGVHTDEIFSVLAVAHRADSILRPSLDHAHHQHWLWFLSMPGLPDFSNQHISTHMTLFPILPLSD